MIAFYKQFFGEGDLVFDIGACHGQLASRFLEAGAGYVIAVEPNPTLALEMISTFKNNENIHIVQAAVGEEPGYASLLTCSRADTISTLAPEWKTGRFQNEKFDGKITVSVTTLDSLIGVYGVPKYIKMDIEGYEAMALRGLHTPVHSLSFEFVSEFFEKTRQCVRRLQRIGNYEFSYAQADFEDLEFPFTDGDAMLKKLADHQGRHYQLWGNVFARLKE